MSAYQPTRREILRVGGGSLLGLSLPQMLQLQALASGSERHAPGWRTARSVILIFLQGGPSHLDLWDPKDGVPDDVVSPFATIPSRVPGMEVTELLPHLATALHAAQEMALLDAIRPAATNATNKPKFRCASCDTETPAVRWRCPSCGAWEEWAGDAAA